MAEYKEYRDEDFLGNKINIGDMVIFEAPKYRHFTIGKVITKAPKSCQIEYVNNWNYSDSDIKEIVRQGYGQIIKHLTTDVTEVIHGYWKGIEVKDTCSVCNRSISEIYDADSWIRTEVLSELIACPFCGAVMQNS